MLFKIKKKTIFMTSQNTTNDSFIVDRFGISFSGTSSLQKTTSVPARKMCASGFERTFSQTFLHFLSICHLQIVPNKFAPESPNAGARSKPVNPPLIQAFDGDGRDAALVL